MILDLTFELQMILLIIFSIIGFVICKKTKNNVRFWVIPVFIFYVLAVLEITQFPIYIFDQKTLVEWTGGYESICLNLIPFHSIVNYFTPETVIQLIGNLVLLLPLAVFIEIFKHGSIKMKNGIIFIVVTAFLIEFGQFLNVYLTKIPWRVVDIDDFILNVSGAVITLLLIRVLEKRFKNTAISKLINKILYE